MEKKRIVLSTDDHTTLADLSIMAREWYEANKDDIKIESGIYGVKRRNDPDRKIYDQTLTITYTGTEKVPTQQECRHSSTEIVTKAATCTIEGIKVTKCKTCGKIIKSEQIQMIPHTFEFTFNNDATCDKDGTETGICAICGHKYKRIKEGSKLTHNFTEWGTDIFPTFTQPGSKWRMCTLCGYRQREPLPPMDIDLEITTAFVPGGIIRKEYYAEILTNIPECYSCEFTISDGELPDGLELNGNRITGIPTIEKLYTFTVTASFLNDTVSKQFSINIVDTEKTITFNPNGGFVDVTTKTVPKGSTIGELPIPTHEELTFGGWFTAEVDGLRIDESFTVTSDITLYARWGETSDIVFGDVTTQFNIAVDGDRTNYQNNPYTIYNRASDGSSCNLAVQTGISSDDGSNNMTTSNKKVVLYLKITNKGTACTFDVGFDCDSYVSGNDKCRLERIAGGVRVANRFNVTVDTDNSVWIGQYGDRTNNRYKNMAIGSTSSPEGSSVDTGYAFTINNIFINGGSYAIIPVTFKRD